MLILIWIHAWGRVSALFAAPVGHRFDNILVQNGVQLDSPSTCVHQVLTRCISLVGSDSLVYPWLRGGIAAGVAYTLLIFISIRPIRKVAYEFFCYSHMILIT